MDRDAGVDPDLPIRGRYVSLNLVLPVVEESPLEPSADLAYGRIEVRDGRAVAVLAGGSPVRDATHPIGFARNIGRDERALANARAGGVLPARARARSHARPAAR